MSPKSTGTQLSPVGKFYWEERKEKPQQKHHPDAVTAHFQSQVWLWVHLVLSSNNTIVFNDIII